MRGSRVAIFLALVCVLYAAWGGLYLQRTSIVVDETRVYTLWDDAMISMRYAANLAAGDGLVWNAGEEPVQGFTNLGITLAMAVVHLLPVSPFKISLVVQLLNLAALLLILLLVWRASEALFPRSPGIALGSVLGTALSGPLAVWGLQGADTTLAALWLMVPVATLARRSRETPGRADWPLWLWAWIALGPVIRLDCVIYSLVFIAAAGRNPSGRVRQLMVGGLSTGLVLAGLVAFSFFYYGDPLPNTYYLKSTGTPRSHMLITGLVQLAVYWAGLLLALGIAIYTAYRDRARPLLVEMTGLVLIAVFYTVWVGGDWAPQTGIRFIVPVLPILLILTTAGCWQILGGAEEEVAQAGAGVAPMRPVALAVALVVALILSPRPALFEWLSPSAETMYHADNERNVLFGLYLDQMTEPETRIAVHWGGVAPYLSGRPAIDVLGKSDRHIARMKVSNFAPGHSKWDWEYTLREQRPDLFLIISRGLHKRPDFRSSYYGVTTEYGLVYYLRRDARHLINDPSIQLTDLTTGMPLSPEK